MRQASDLFITSRDNDTFVVTRMVGGGSYTVYSRDDLARQIVREARQGVKEFPGVPFIVEDSEGRRCAYDPDRCTFDYETKGTQL